MLWSCLYSLILHHFGCIYELCFITSTQWPRFFFQGGTATSRWCLGYGRPCFWCQRRSTWKCKPLARKKSPSSPSTSSSRVQIIRTWLVVWSFSNSLLPVFMTNLFKRTKWLQTKMYTTFNTIFWPSLSCDCTLCNRLCGLIFRRGV